MPTAKKLPSGTWRVRAYIGKSADGKPRYKSFTAKTKKAAELAAAQYQLTDHAERDRLTVGKAIDDYITFRAPELSPSTLLGYKRQRKNCYTGISDKDIHTITNDDLQLWIRGFAIGHSAKYVANAYGLLYSALRRYRPEFSPHIDLPKAAPHRIAIPEPADMTAYFDAVTGTALEIPFLLASQCGLRASEIAGLAVSDVDILNSTITIRQARVTGEYGAVLKSPKTYAGYRELPCNPQICRLCAAQPGPYVTALTAQQISGAWAKLVRRHGLTVCGFHALRHFFASRSLLIGVPKEYLVELMGHSSSKMIDDVYAHCFNSVKRSYGQLIAAQSNAFFMSDMPQNMTNSQK